MPSIYDYPLYYDIAFERDLEPEIAFLEACMARWRDEPVRRILELGCGPAYHTRRLARGPYTLIGLDRSAPMLAYAAERAGNEQVAAEFVTGDMMDFHLPSPVDLVLSMMATASHIMTLEQMVIHLRTVADNLTPDGLYILELPHPRDIFQGGGDPA